MLEGGTLCPPGVSQGPNTPGQIGLTRCNLARNKQTKKTEYAKKNRLLFNLSFYYLFSQKITKADYFSAHCKKKEEPCEP